MSRVRIKFCGITNAEDALAAVECGVDALGFVFYAPSPRAVGVEQAAAIVRQLPPFVATVGLFVNACESVVATTVDAVGLDYVQFHGDETAAFCALSPRPWIKAIRIGAETDIMAAAAAYPQASALLLDTLDPHVYGGSGRAFDWQRIPELAQPVILAGGLNAANVATAISTARPYAVDVSGGIELEKGKKDINKMMQFTTEVARLER